MKKTLTAIVATTICSSSIYAIDLDQVEIFGYGNIYYQSYDYLRNYQSPPEHRAQVDLERFVLSPRFIINNNYKIVSEIEFEHGGTGATMEHDMLDEFGEYEQEIEKGGEITTEEVYLDISQRSWMNFKIGHMVVPVGLNSQRHLPSLYLSTSRNISETTIIPNTWNETGAMAYGKVGDFHYQAMIMSGLNSEYFDSSHWIQTGSQKQFETVNADNLAFALRVDYGNVLKSHIGTSFYIGDSNQNRNNAKLASPGTVKIVDVHAIYDEGNIRFRSMALLGMLSNSEAITRANHNLSNLSQAVRTPVAREALAYFVELGYNIAPLFNYAKEITPFVKYDFVDSMHKTEGIVIKDDRYERTSYTAGIDYFLTPEIVFKGDFRRTSYGPKSKIDDLDAFTLALGFQF